MNSATVAPVFTKEDELHWLALRLVPGLGCRKAGQLLSQFRTPQGIFRASRSELEAGGLTGRVAQSIASGCTFEDAADQQQKMLRSRRALDPDLAIRAIRRAARDLRSAARAVCARPGGTAAIA